jgi:catechol 2,3-dioxygenase
MTMPTPHIGRVALAVADIERSIGFYTDVIGLTLLTREGDDAQMGAGTEPLLLLHGQAGLSRVRRATGLYHFALLLPSRADLGDALQHYVEVNAPISGFADHAVSEAIYLTDPDGHGIEVYRDRPREEWAYTNGALRMTTEPIDFDGVLRSRSGAWRGLPPGTMMGHIHLQVAQIEATERFYIDLIGQDLVLRYGPSATFLSANGYHHHIGGNTWAGAGLPPAPPTRRGCCGTRFASRTRRPLTPSPRVWRRRAMAHERDTTGLRVVDPSGIQLLLTAH